MCGPKCKKGLVVRKTEEINTAVLAKHGWNILTQPDNTLVQLMKAKVF